MTNVTDSPDMTRPLTWQAQARAAGWRRPAPPKEHRRTVENPEYVAMVKRLLTRLGERAGDDPTTLGALAELRDSVNTALTAAVTAARQSDPPYSWTHIGRELGLTKQAAQQWHERNTR